MRLSPERTFAAGCDLRSELPPEVAVLQQLATAATAAGDLATGNAFAQACRDVEDAGRRGLGPYPSNWDPRKPPSRAEWVSELAQSLPFELDLSYKFRRRDHINVLEANVRLSLMKHLARSPANFATRQLLGQDSRVNLGAFAKGRSSARRLNHVEAKAGAYELAADLQIGGLWVDSFRMPADAPTRGGGLVLPVPARPWVAAFLAGDLAALDARLQ